MRFRWLYPISIVIAMIFNVFPPSHSREDHQHMNQWPRDQYSPDGRFVAVMTNNRLAIKNASTGNVIWIYPKNGSHTIWGFHWSPDSKKIAVSDAGCVRVLDATEGDEVYVFGGMKGDAFAPDWSPDGRYLAAIGTRPGTDPKRPVHSVIAWNAVSQRVLIEITGELPGSSVLWAPDSIRLAFNTDQQNVQIWNALTHTKLVTIPFDGGGRPPFCWSPDGKYIVIADWNVSGAIIHESENGKAIAKHVFHEDVHGLDWSRDGKKIICTPLYGPEQNWDLEYVSSGELKTEVVKVKTPGEPGYMPKTLDECFAQLDAELSPDIIKKMKSGTKDDMILYHHGLGTSIRNRWGLWSQSQLRQNLAASGLHHPDDMSALILEMYWCHLHGQPTNLKH